MKRRWLPALLWLSLGFSPMAVASNETVCLINLTGHYPYIENKIRKRLNLQVGDNYDPAVIEEQKERILRFFDHEGYHGTQVTAEAKESERENCLDLHFHIRKGVLFRYDQIRFEGVKTVLPGRLHSILSLMSVYSERKLKNSLHEIEMDYQSRGFLRARATLVEKKINEQTKRVQITVRLYEGPRIKIFYQGKMPLQRKTRNGAITLYRAGSFDNIELKISAEALEQKLHEAGYPEAKVSFEKVKKEEDLYHIFFRTEPGPRRFVSGIKFQGNDSIGSRKLRKQLLSREHSLSEPAPLQPENFPHDQQLAGDFYRSEGFPAISIGDPIITMNKKKTRYTLTYPVNEGGRILIEKITLDDETFPQQKILKLLKNHEGDPLNIIAIPYDEEMVRLYYRNHGYPYVSVVSVQQGSEIHFQIVKGPLVRIGEINFRGDVLTGIKPMQQALGIKSGDPYSEQKITEASLNLRRLGAFRAAQVEPIGLGDKKETIPLDVKVEEQQPFAVDLETQFSTDEQYSGTFKFTNYNSFGWAKQTRLLFKGGIEKDRAELSWLDPRLFGHDLQMSTASWIDYNKNPRQTVVETGGSTSFFRLFHRFGFLSKYQLTRNYPIAGQPTDPNALRDSTLSAITLSGSYDIRNNFSDPDKGFYALLTTQIVNEIKGEEANFAKFKTAFSQFYTPWRRFTFQSMLRLDRIQDIGAKASVPQSELFDLGGDDTLRGFREDQAGPLNAQGVPIGGRIRTIFNEELHIRLIKNMQWAFFYDLGSLTDSVKNIDSSTLRHSSGFGLRYVTPIGPIRADYGIILDHQPNENFGRFHLTFGYPF